MKLNCPECSTQFDVPNDMFNSGARRVRCSTCNHIWMQEAVDETAFSKAFQRHDDDLRIEPIPASLHPDMELAAVMDAEPKPGFFADIHWGYLGRMIGGFACGAVLVAAMVYGFEASKTPPMVVEAVKAEALKGGDTIKVSGKVVNKSDHAMAIPDLDVVPLDGDDMEGEGVRLNLSSGALDPNASVDFVADVQDSEQRVTNVRLRFLAH